MPTRVAKTTSSVPVATAALLLGASLASSQTILRVDPDVAASGSGATWADAIRSLDDALAMADAIGGTHEVWVRAGTYVPSVRSDATVARSATFAIADEVSILGGFAGHETDAAERDPRTNATVLLGDLDGDDGPGFENMENNAFHVVTKTGDGTIDGFTIRAGNAFHDLPIGHSALGAGVFLSGGFGEEPRVSSCVFLDHQADRGASIGSVTGCRVDRCVFRQNRTLGTTSGGAGVHNDAIGRAAIITNSLFVANNSNASGPASSFYAGLLIANCTFVGNSAAFNSAVNAQGPGAFLALSNSIIRDNVLNDGTPDAAPVWSPFLDISSVGACSISGLPPALDGNGNADLVAGFIDPIGPDAIPYSGDEDLRLRADSACLDIGLAAPIGHISVPPFDLPPTDLSGLARITDADGDGIAYPDLGAYERTAPCVCETDGTDGISIGDLLVYLVGWFVADPVAERTGDETVTVLDLLAFLDCWLGSSDGACAD